MAQFSKGISFLTVHLWWLAPRVAMAPRAGWFYVAKKILTWQQQDIEGQEDLQEHHSLRFKVRVRPSILKLMQTVKKLFYVSLFMKLHLVYPVSVNVSTTAHPCYPHDLLPADFYFFPMKTWTKICEQFSNVKYESKMRP